MSESATRTGSRAVVPADAMKVCPSCQRPRGTQRRGWHPITRDGSTIGFTCDSCPTWDEPIRREVLKNGAVRFLCVVVVRVDGKRLQRKRRFDSLAAARAWVVEARDGLRDTSTWADPEQLTVRDICEKWITHRRQEVASGGVREVTVNGYSSALHPLLLHLGDTRARKVTAGQIEDALRAMATTGGERSRPLSHRTLSYSLGSLRMVMAYAEREGWLTTNPAARSCVPSVRRRTTADDGRVRVWAPDQLVQFRAALGAYADGERFAREPWLQVGMLTSLCGLRRSEVLGLDWQAVDMRTGAVEIRASRVKTGRGSETVLGAPKTDNSHRTVLAREIHGAEYVRALRALQLHQGRPASGLVIADPLGPLHPDRFSRAFLRLCDEADVPRLTRIHNIRHSLARFLQASGVPDHQAAALLGHDVHTYRRFYLLVDDDSAAPAARSIGGLFAVN